MTLAQDVAKLREDVDKLSTYYEENSKGFDRHEEQINGRRGLQSSIDDLTKEVKSLRKAAYWVGGLIVAGAITFSFSVMALIGQ